MYCAFSMWQNLPWTDYTVINKPVETHISICSSQLKHALFTAEQDTVLCQQLQPLTYAEAALSWTTALWKVAPDSKGK